MKILDACCGGRMFWFDKNNKDTLYIDKRDEINITGKGIHRRVRKCRPDKIMDFRNMQIDDKTFKLVVFDPPHLFVGEDSYIAKTYGRLDKETWREDIKKGFSECFRVLKEDGVLIFKWNEYDIPIKEILKLAEYNPLFGHPSGKSQRTHWICFMKSDTNLNGDREYGK